MYKVLRAGFIVCIRQEFLKYQFHHAHLVLLQHLVPSENEGAPVNVDGQAIFVDTGPDGCSTLRGHGGREVEVDDEGVRVGLEQVGLACVLLTHHHAEEGIEWVLHLLS